MADQRESVRDIVSGLLRPNGQRQEITVREMAQEMIKLGYRDTKEQQLTNNLTNHYLKETVAVKAITALELGYVLRALRNLSGCSIYQACHIIAQIRLSGLEIAQLFQTLSRHFEVQADEFRRVYEAVTPNSFTQVTPLRAELPIPNHFRQLPAPAYSRLWGVVQPSDDENGGECDDAIVPITRLSDQLTQALMGDSLLRVINVFGFGGLGKTSVIHYTMTQIATHFSDKFAGLCWVAIESLHTLQSNHVSDLEMNRRVTKVLDRLCDQLEIGDVKPLKRDEKLNRIQRKLNAADRKYIIVIDNLQSPEDILALSDIVTQCVSNAWVVLTCRGSLLDRTRLAYKGFEVAPLNCNDTIRMCRFEATNRDRPIDAILNTPSGHLEALWNATRGHPQAVKVLVAQMEVVDSTTALNSIEQGIGSTVTQMYIQIYGSTWRILTPTAQRILRQIALEGDRGTDLEGLTDLFSETTMDNNTLISGLNQLYQRNLINVDLSDEIPRYSVHQITYNFVRSVIMKLEEAGDFQI